VGHLPSQEDSAFAAQVMAMTSAFGDPTRRGAWLFAREAGSRGVTATEVAEHLELHPNVARHHLDKLAASTYLEVFVDRVEGASAGRPSKRYRVISDVDVNVPGKQADLLVTLLGRALALLPADQAEQMAERVGEDYGRQLAASMAPENQGGATRSFRTVLHAVADALTAHGFAAHAEARGSSIAVIAEHCPFGSTASQHPVICAVDRGMVRGLLAGLGVDRSPELSQSRAMGDSACVTLL
jgi:predicted ArsR family transcriptional regulator